MTSYWDYVNQLIPPQQRWKLDRPLDEDNETNRDLRQVAEFITEWEVKLVGPLGLTPGQVEDINTERKPELRRRLVLNKWKESNGLLATYGSLLAKCVEGNHISACRIICKLLAGGPGGQQGGPPAGQLGGAPPHGGWSGQQSGVPPQGSWNQQPPQGYQQPPQGSWGYQPSGPPPPQGSWNYQQSGPPPQGSWGYQPSGQQSGPYQGNSTQHGGPPPGQAHIPSFDSAAQHRQAGQQSSQGPVATGFVGVNPQLPIDSLVEDYHYGFLLEQLHQCAPKWEAIATGLRFKNHEIDTIRVDPMKMTGGPSAYLGAVISEWTHWAPGDARGSKDRSRLGALKKAVNRAGFGVVAQKLTLDE